MTLPHTTYPVSHAITHACRSFVGLCIVGYVLLIKRLGYRQGLVLYSDQGRNEGRE